MTEMKREEFEGVSAEVAAERGKAIRAAEAKLTEVEGKVDAKNKELENARAEVASTQSQLKDAQGKLDKLKDVEGQIEARERELAKLELDVASERGKVVAAKGDLEKAEREVKARNLELAGLDSDVASKRVELRKAGDRLGKASRIVAKQVERVGARGREVNSKREELQKMRGELTEKRGLVNLAERERARAMKDSLLASIDAAKAKGEVGRFKDELETVKTELDTKGKELESARAEVASENEKLNAVRSEVASYEERFQKIVREIPPLDFAELGIIKEKKGIVEVGLAGCEKIADWYKTSLAAQNFLSLFRELNHKGGALTKREGELDKRERGLENREADVNKRERHIRGIEGYESLVKFTERYCAAADACVYLGAGNEFRVRFIDKAMDFVPYVLEKSGWRPDLIKKIGGHVHEQLYPASQDTDKNKSKDPDGKAVTLG